MPASLGGAFQIATDVARALPPPWDVTAPLVSTFGDLFTFFFPNRSTSPPNVSTLEEISTGGALPALSTAINQMGTSETGDICTPNTNSQAAYLPTFALGVSTYLLFAKYWIAMAASAGVSPSDLPAYAKTPIYNLNMASTSGSLGWINYAQAVSLAFQTLVAARLSQVGPATPYFIYRNGATFVYFRDSGEPVDGLHPDNLFVNLVVPGQPQAFRHVFWPGKFPSGSG